LANLNNLLTHPAFSMANPNKCYSLIGGFAASPTNFHQLDGSGYTWLADQVIKLNGINAQVASRMVGPFTRWKKYDAVRQGLMKAQLERIMATEGLSDNLFEIVSKSLE
jgi:aminopeptidase N